MTLLELLGLMRKHLTVVIALPVIFALITAGVSFFVLPNQYTASTSMYILTKASTESNALTSTDLSASQMLTNDVATLMNSTRVQTEAATAVGLDSLRGFTTKVDSSTTTRLITVSVTGTDPSDAAIVANSLAKVADDVAKEVMDIQSINVIDPASEPTSPSGPPRLMYTLVAALAGLFVAIAFIVIADMANTRVRSGEEAADLLGLPVIGRIPVIKS